MHLVVVRRRLYELLPRRSPAEVLRRVCLILLFRECRRQRTGRQSAAATVLRIVMRALFFASKNFREDVDNRETLQAECERRSTIQQCNDSARCLSFYA